MNEKGCVGVTLVLFGIGYMFSYFNLPFTLFLAGLALLVGLALMAAVDKR